MINNPKITDSTDTVTPKHEHICNAIRTLSSAVDETSELLSMISDSAKACTDEDMIANQSTPSLAEVLNSSPDAILHEIERLRDLKANIQSALF